MADKIEAVVEKCYRDDCSDLIVPMVEAYRRGFRRGVEKARSSFPYEYQRLKKKETPMKPTHEATIIKPYTCPTCKQVQREWYRRCPFCGQALDWTEATHNKN